VTAFCLKIIIIKIMQLQRELQNDIKQMLHYQVTKSGFMV